MVISKDIIKTCPFCGEEPKINQRYTVTDWEVDSPVEELMYLVECENDNCPCYVESKMYKTKELAIKAWNTRKPMEVVVSKMETEIEENQDASLSEYRAGLYKAIEIVKAGGIDES